MRRRRPKVHKRIAQMPYMCLPEILQSQCPSFSKNKKRRLCPKSKIHFLYHQDGSRKPPIQRAALPDLGEGRHPARGDVPAFRPHRVLCAARRAGPALQRLPGFSLLTWSFLPRCLCCRQSPRRHIQTRDAADGEQYQVVHTDSTNILIRWVSSARRAAAAE